MKYQFLTKFFDSLDHEDLSWIVANCRGNWWRSWSVAKCQKTLFVDTDIRGVVNFSNRLGFSSCHGFIIENEFKTRCSMISRSVAGDDVASLFLSLGFSDD